MKCDICGIDYAKGLHQGIRTKILVYEDHQNRLTKRWKVIRRRKKVFVCRKCADILKGLIVNYRRG